MKLFSAIKNKRILFIVPIVALALIVFSSFFKNTGFGFFVITDYMNKSSQSIKSGNELLEGDNINVIYKSKYKNFGTFSIRFTNNNRDSNDVIRFKLYSSSSDIPIFSGDYQTNQFLPDEYFTFGFPIITNSNNKTYRINIESLNGETGSGIFLSFQKPIFAARHHFDRSNVLNNPPGRWYFIFNKLRSSLGSLQGLSFTEFFIPIFLYLILLIEKNDYSISTFIFVSYFAFALIENISLSPTINWSIIIFWVLNSLKNKLGSKVSALFLVTLTLVSCFEYIVGDTSRAILATNLSLVSLLISAIVLIIENILADQKFSDHKHFINNILFNKSSTKIENRLTLYLISSLVIIYVTNKISANIFVFKKFYLSTYLFHFIVNLLLPSLILTAIYLLIIKKIVERNKKIYIYIFITIVSYFSLSNSLIALATNFQYKTKIIHVGPSVTSEAWTDVIITGLNFENTPFIGKVEIDGVRQQTLDKYWTDNRIIFRTNPTTTKSGNLCVTNQKGIKSNCVEFIYNFK